MKRVENQLAGVEFWSSAVKFMGCVAVYDTPCFQVPWKE